jgi:hypothetical protein
MNDANGGLAIVKRVEDVIELQAGRPKMVSTPSAASELTRISAPVGPTCVLMAAIFSSSSQRPMPFGGCNMLSRHGPLFRDAPTPNLRP